jgi:GNAT superfamily N-acetyltransferase
MKDFTLRTMSLQDLEVAVAWAAREGWNPGLHDAETFYRTDPEGFLLGMLRGEPVATLSCVRYGVDFGFMGFYIVRPEDRNKGYGGHLAKAALEHLRDCRSIGLDGVEEQQHNYARHGFRIAHHNIRFQGYGTGFNSPTRDGSQIASLEEVPFEELLAYDTRHFPTARPHFLKEWIKQPESLSLALLRRGKLAGFLVRRRCPLGHKIGPLFADHPGDAASLLEAAGADLAHDDPFFLDVPESNTAALALTSQFKMKPVFKTARMYLGEMPNLPLHEIYGITTFELG